MTGGPGPFHGHVPTGSATTYWRHESGSIPAPVRVMAVSPQYASVCTRCTEDDTTTFLDTRHPTGLARGWRRSTELVFPEGGPNPSVCPRHDTHRHELYEC